MLLPPLSLCEDDFHVHNFCCTYAAEPIAAGIRRLSRKGFAANERIRRWDKRPDSAHGMGAIHWNCITDSSYQQTRCSLP